MPISANKGGGCKNGHPPILAVANNLLIQAGNREEQQRKYKQSKSLEMPDFTGFSALGRSAGSSEENGKNDLLSGRLRVRIAPGSPKTMRNLFNLQVLCGQTIANWRGFSLFPCFSKVSRCLRIANQMVILQTKMISHLQKHS